jgi:hypothetical protein
MSSSVQGVRILTCFTDTWLAFVEASSSDTNWSQWPARRKVSKY